MVRPSEDLSEVMVLWSGDGGAEAYFSPGRTPLAKVRTVCPGFWLQTNKLDLIPEDENSLVDPDLQD